MDPAVSLLAKSSILARYLICINTVWRVASGFGKALFPLFLFLGSNRPLGSGRRDGVLGRTYVWTGGCMAEGRKESAIACRVSFWRVEMVPFPLGVFQMSSSNGKGAGFVCVYPGLMTWRSACCPANGRACVQMGCAVVQTVSTAQS